MVDNVISPEDLRFSKLASVIRCNNFSGKIEISVSNGAVTSSRFNVSASEMEKSVQVAKALKALEK